MAHVEEVRREQRRVLVDVLQLSVSPPSKMTLSSGWAITRSPRASAAVEDGEALGQPVLAEQVVGVEEGDVAARRSAAPARCGPGRGRPRA